MNLFRFESKKFSSSDNQIFLFRLRRPDGSPALHQRHAHGADLRHRTSVRRAVQLRRGPGNLELSRLARVRADLGGHADCRVGPAVAAEAAQEMTSHKSLDESGEVW